MHCMIFRGGMYRKPVNIVYFELKIWKSNGQIKDT